jgi:hypothetical protein
MLLTLLRLPTSWSNELLLAQVYPHICSTLISFQTYHFISPYLTIFRRQKHLRPYIECAHASCTDISVNEALWNIPGKKTISRISSKYNQTGKVRIRLYYGAFVLPFLQWKSNKYYIFCGVSVAWGIQHAMRMRRMVICGLYSSTVFSVLSHKRHDFRKKKVLNIRCAFRVSSTNLSETFFILRRTKRDMIKNVYWSSCKVNVITVRF